MRLHKFDPADGSFEHIANDDGSPAITFYQLGTAGTHFQVVTGGEGSVNFDAKTASQDEDVDVGLWPQRKGGVYIQSETRPNWVKISPSDVGGDILVTTGGAPYAHEVGVLLTLQGGPVSRLPAPADPAAEGVLVSALLGRIEALEHQIEALKTAPQRLSRLAILRALFRLPGR